ncbi:MauE/DoxX family redox-associated membrane protein [Pedobacter nyackensis]|uniref:Methylamine utilisation protein MauE domain-containing protein n=1 Tax=Pedobacter nyackensis TaxID=475255 RepID=A0A1W2DV01_9SPHI|nr:MauE/DoxX family redox-associated membrane protein [Pedobacter nyackensis]SMD01304.1 hypothetical protein SAMN04488101_108162 [Pedobacter nyackensis]
MASTIISKDKFQFTDTIREHLAFGIVLTCLFLFLTSAYTKIEEHDRFMNGLLKVAFISHYAWLISWTVPVAEIVVSLFLIIPKTHKWGLYGFIGLMMVFTIYIGSMLLWSEKLPCHCNLLIEKLSWGEHVVFNLAFVGLAAFALWLIKNNQYKSLIKQNDKY